MTTTMTLSAAPATLIRVSLPCGGEFPSDEPCRWSEMHHLDDEGNHWCPTGFMWCETHAGIGTIDGPAQCQLWGESDG